MGHHHDEDDDEFDNEHEHDGSHGGGFVSGALIGALVGMAAGLLLAPAAGQETRRKLRDSAVSARDQAMEAAGDAREKAVHVVEETRARAEDMQQTGREMIEDNKRRLVRTAEAVKQSAQEAWTTPADKPAATSPAAGSAAPSGKVTFTDAAGHAHHAPARKTRVAAAATRGGSRRAAKRA